MGRTVHACLRVMSSLPCWCLQALKTRGTGCQLNFDEAVYAGLMSLLPSVTVVSIICCHLQLAPQSTAAYCAVQSEHGLLLALLILQAGTSCRQAHLHVNLQQSLISLHLCMWPVLQDQVVEALRYQSKGHIAVLIDPEQPLGLSKSSKVTYAQSCRPG